MELNTLKKSLRCLLLFSFVFLTSCEDNSNRADEILEKSLKAHGGKAQWEKMKYVNYLKKTTLYDSTGAIEKEILQKITHHWRPERTEIQWVDDSGVLIRALKLNGTIKLFKNSELETDTLLLEQTKANLEAALYVYWQPYKLLDPGTQLKYIGTKKLLDTLPVEALEVRYSDDPKADVWTYFFDQTNFRLRATQVKHNNNISLIVNESVEKETGLYLNKERKSYFVNASGKIKYLRAAYRYDLTFFERDQ